MTPNGVESYPKIYGAIREMARKEALRVPTARGVARKAGLRSVPEVQASPATLIDATVGPSFTPLEWQWLVDLSAYTRLRFDARGADPLFARYSLTGASTEALNPSDYAPFAGGLSAEDSGGYPPDALGWMTLAEEERVPVRLCLITSGGVLSEEVDLGGPVGVWIQAE